MDRAALMAPARRLRACLGLLCLYGLLAAWWLRPVTWELRDHVPGPAGRNLPNRVVLGDLYLTLWILTAGAQQLATDPASLFHPPVFYPERYTLAYSEHLLGHQLLFGPPYGLSGNPVLALDLSLLCSTTLLGLGTHLLVRRWGGGVAAAIFAASLAIAAPWRVGAALARPHTLWVHYLPFTLLFLDRYIAAPRRLDLALAATCLGLQMLTSYYAGYAALVMVVVHLTAHSRRSPGRVVCAALGIGAALGVAAAVSYPYLVLARAGVVRPLVSAELVSGLLSVWGSPAVLTAYFVGIVPVACTALLTFLRPWQHRAPYGTLIAIAAAGYTLAIGPELPLPRSLGGALRALWDLLAVTDPGVRTTQVLFKMGRDAYRIPMPYALLAAVIPGFEQLRATSRFGVLPATILPITAALALDHAARRLARLGWLPALGGAAVILAKMPATIGLPIEVGAAMPPAYQWLRVHGDGRPLLEAPIRSGLVGVSDIERDGRAMYLATYHRLPLLNGYGGYAPEAFKRRAALAERLPDPGALAALCAETGLGWVLLHREQLAPRSRSAWAEPPPVLRVAATFGDDVVFSVTCEGRRG